MHGGWLPGLVCMQGSAHLCEGTQVRTSHGLAAKSCQRLFSTKRPNMSCPAAADLILPAAVSLLCRLLVAAPASALSTIVPRVITRQTHLGTRLIAIGSFRFSECGNHTEQTSLCTVEPGSASAHEYPVFCCLLGQYNSRKCEGYGDFRSLGVITTYNM